MTSVSLGDMLNRQVALGWAEAVAIIAELCTVLTRDGGPGAQIPDPTQILLTADGTVTIRSDGRGASPGTTPGRLLHTLLASSDAPSPLRLFVSVAISSDRYDSVGTFGEALAYYEVPGRGPLIQAAYQRSAGAPGGPVAATPLPVPELPGKVSPVKAARPKVPTWAFAAAAASLGAAAVALWFSGVLSSPLGDAAPGDKTAVAEVAVAEKKTAARGAAGVGASSDAPQGSTTDSSSRRSPADSGPLVRLSDKGGYVPNTGASSNAVGTSAVGASTTAPSEGAEPAGEAIYSSASPGVQPPVAISPLPVTGLNPSLESIGTIELLVNEDGKVAHVRLVSQPSRMQPLMLLSAAKTWTFRPALREGRPVKFRLQVKVPSTIP